MMFCIEELELAEVLSVQYTYSTSLTAIMSTAARLRVLMKLDLANVDCQELPGTNSQDLGRQRPRTCSQEAHN